MPDLLRFVLAYLINGFLFAFADTLLFRGIQTPLRFSSTAIWRIVGYSAFHLSDHLVGGAHDLIALVRVFLSYLYLHHA
jgi:hypothetical protein